MSNTKEHGGYVVDISSSKIESVLQVTSNSYLVTRTKLTDKGINCDNWFERKHFNEKFAWIL